MPWSIFPPLPLVLARSSATPNHHSAPCLRGTGRDGLGFRSRFSSSLCSDNNQRQGCFLHNSVSTFLKKVF
nr:MAG TPA: hypothetical protein [Caudoviricetes sp.]